jgi:hypothetical protein
VYINPNVLILLLVGSAETMHFDTTTRLDAFFAEKFCDVPAAAMANFCA